MEKKKLLLVAISTGIFLVLSIGAAIVVFSPKNTASSSGVIASRPSAENSGGSVPPSSYQPPAVNPSAPLSGQGGSQAEPSQGSGGSSAAESPPLSESSGAAPVDALDLVKNPGEVPGLQIPPEGTVRQEGDFYVNGADQSGAGSNTGTVITVPKPVVVAAPTVAPPAVKPPSTPRPAATQAASKPAEAVQPAPRPSTPASRPQSKPAVQTRLYNDFWVQTGAFSTVAKAEGVKETLASKGITSIIENRQIDGKTVFRVRVGPYTSQNEADYWLSLVKSIEGFEKSLVMQTPSRR